MIKPIISLLFLSLSLAACGDPATTAGGPSPKSLLPDNAELAAIYQRSCKACHSRGLSGAPVTANQAQWRPRIAKGMETLLEHTLGGFKGMPPRGNCMDCSPQQYQQLIRFMAQWPVDTSANEQPSAEQPGAEEQPSEEQSSGDA